MIEAFLSGVARDPRRLFRALLAGGLVLLAVLDAVLLGTATVPAGSLRLELRSDSAAKIVASFDTGGGFLPQESVARSVLAGPQTQTLSFPLPPQPVRKLWIGLVGDAPTLNLHSVSVVRDEDGAESSAYDLQTISSPEVVEELTPYTEGLEIVTSPFEAATWLRIPLEEPISLVPTAWQWAVRLSLLDATVFVLYGASVFVALFGWPRWSIFLPRWDNLWALAIRWFPDRWSALLFLVPVACAACAVAALQRGSYYLEAELKCDRAVVAQFYFDSGTGYHEADSTRESVPASASFRKVRFPIPVDALTGVRFDPAEGPVKMRLNTISVRSAAEDWLGGAPLYDFNLRTLWPLQQMTELVHEDDGTVRLLVAEEFNDPATRLELPARMTFGVNWLYVVVRTLFFALGWLLVWIAAFELGIRLPARWVRGASAAARAGWRRLSPAQAVWLVAAASVVLSCYPVIFCGKSFASVNFEDGTYQLYYRFPTLPGSTDATVESGHGSDVGALAWQAAAENVLAGRALFHGGELPLWDRYTGGGAPLLGQGQTMVGDPLQWLVLAAGGQAWAWDVKFLLAKLLFVAGVGLLVLLATACLPAALLLSFSAAFLGYWSFRLNHPAYFSLCYAPWILLAWVELARAAAWRRALAWAIGLVLIDWTELNSGSIPEAFALLAYLNLTGLLFLLLTPRQTVRFRFQRLLFAAAGSLIFCLLAAPLWLTFFDALGSSVGGTGPQPARQLPPGLLIGLFDDLFYRQLIYHETHFEPSANFLVLAGVLAALSSGKRLLNDRLFVAVSLSAVLLLAVVFGGMPLDWANLLPLVGGIARLDTAFSTVLFVYLLVIAGFGLKQWLLQPSRRRWVRDLLVAAVIGAVLLGAYFQLLTSPASEGRAALKLGQTVLFSSFFDGYVPVLVAAVVLLPLVLRHLWLRGPAVAPVLLLACCLFLIHWRQGIQLPGAFGQYTPALPDRLDLLAHSPAIDFLHADQEGPFRGVGLGGNLMPGYNAIAGIEGFDNPGTFASPYVAELKTDGMRFTPDWMRSSLDKTRLAAAKRFYDLFNVRYYLALPGDSLAAVPGLRLIGKLDLDVYRNETAWPRAFFVDRLQEYSGAQDYAKEMNVGDGHPFAAVERSEFLTAPWLAGRFDAAQAGRTVVPAARYRLTANGTAFDIDAPGAGVVVLTEAFYPDAISARIDGQPTPVFRVNHAFRGILVEGPGHYQVSFAYRPPHFSLALAGSLLGWVLLGAAGWLLWRTRTIRPSAPKNGAREIRPPSPAALAGGRSL